MNLQEFRQKYPQYKDWSDQDLSKSLYEKYYAQNMTWPQFTKSFGYTPSPSVPVAVGKEAAPKQDAVSWEGNIPLIAEHPMLDKIIASAEYGYAGAKSLAVEAGTHLGAVAADVVNAMRGEAAIQPQDIKAEEAQFASRETPEQKRLASDIPKPVRKTLGKGVQYIGHSYTKGVEHLADLEAAGVEKYAGPKAAAVTDALIKGGGAALPFALTVDNPVARELSGAAKAVRETAGAVTQPVKATIRDAVSQAVDRFGGQRLYRQIPGAVQLGHLTEASKRLYAYLNNSYLLDKQATGILEASKDLSPEDHIALERYQEDPTGTYPLTPKQAAFYLQHLAPIRDQADMAPGYLHRVSLEHGNIESQIARGGKKPRPSSFRHFSKTADPEKARSFFRLESQDPNQPDLVAHVEEGKDETGEKVYTVQGFTKDQEQVAFHPKRNAEVGTTITDVAGNKYKITQATRREITQATGHEYVPNSVYSTVRAWHQIMTKRLTEAATEDTKQVLKDYLYTGDKPPDGWVPIESRFFKGAEGERAYAPPPTAYVIDTFLHNAKPSLLKSLGHGLLTMSFVIPVWHDLNMISIAMQEKLPRLLNRESWKHYPESWHEVLNVTGHYKELTEKGYPFWRPAMFPQQLKATSESLLREMLTPRAQTLLDKAGIPAHYVTDGLKWYNNNVMHSVGVMNDVLMLSAIKERMGLYKEDLDTAAAHVARNMPQYRVSPTNRMLHGMSQSGLFWFVPYHVDRIKILWNRLKDSASGDPQALSRLAANIMMAQLVYPSLDKALRQATNDPKAHIERFGTDRIVADILGASDHSQPESRLLGDLITQNSLASAAGQVIEAGYRTKKHGRYPALGKQSKELGKEVAGTINYPLQNVLENEKTLGGAVAGQFGIFIPRKKKKTVTVRR